MAWARGRQKNRARSRLPMTAPEVTHPPPARQRRPPPPPHTPDAVASAAGAPPPAAAPTPPGAVDGRDGVVAPGQPPPAAASVHLCYAAPVPQGRMRGTWRSCGGKVGGVR